MPFTRRQFLVGSAAAVAAGDRLSACQISRALAEVKGPQFIVAALAALNRRGQIDAGLVREYLGYLSVNGVKTILVNGITVHSATTHLQPDTSAANSLTAPIISVVSLIKKVIL